MKQLCDFCIDCMYWWANNSCLTYEEINILLFVIIQPLLIIIGFVFAIVSTNTNNQKIKKYIKRISIIILILCFILSILLILLPIINLK